MVKILCFTAISKLPFLCSIHWAPPFPPHWVEVTLFFTFPILLLECCVKILTFLDFLTICTLQTSIFVNIFCPIYASFVHSISGRVCFASLPDPRLAWTKPPPALDHSIFIDYREGGGRYGQLGRVKAFGCFVGFIRGQLTTVTVITVGYCWWCQKQSQW